MKKFFISVFLSLLLFFNIAALNNGEHAGHKEYKKCLENCRANIYGSITLEESECILECHDAYFA